MGELRVEQRQKVIDRIRQMEYYFDCLQEKVKSGGGPDTPELCEMLDELTAYYENGQWLTDYCLDEVGGLPAELKRGVLSQDGLYDFLSGLDRQN